MLDNEDIKWDELSPYMRMMIKTALAVFIKEQQLDILCRATWDEDDVADEEFKKEVEDFMWDYYMDKLQDEF